MSNLHAKILCFYNFLLSFIQQEILMNLSKLFGPIFMEYKFYTGLLGYNMMDILIWVLNWRYTNIFFWIWKKKNFTHCSNGSYCFIVIAGFILVVTATLRRVYCYRMEWTEHTSSDLVLNQATMLSLSGKSIDLNHRILTKSYSLFCSDKF